MSTNLVASTIIPTSQNCVYKVVNCSFCDSEVAAIDTSNLTVSCQQNLQREWVWIFKNTSDNNFYITANLTVNSKITIDSDLVIEPNTSISFDLSKNSSLLVNGCLSVQGNLNVIVDSKINQEVTYDLITYNCSEKANVSDVQLIYDQKENPCLKSNPKVTLSTISTSISSCERNVPLILGLSIGIPVLVILIAVLILLLSRWKMRQDIKDFKKRNYKDPEMKPESGWNENESHYDKNQTEWNEFEKY